MIRFLLHIRIHNMPIDLNICPPLIVFRIIQCQSQLVNIAFILLSEYIGLIGSNVRHILLDSLHRALPAAVPRVVGVVDRALGLNQKEKVRNLKPFGMESSWFGFGRGKSHLRWRSGLGPLLCGPNLFGLYLISRIQDSSVSH